MKQDKTLNIEEKAKAEEAYLLCNSNTRKEDEIQKPNSKCIKGAVNMCP